ncbi:hypothetical protein HDU93_005559 [Gonapodya sp. JEL0774]|nr:hypothetical protein HDU93_005559 [Gonapodya sp. JEL0774]
MADLALLEEWSMVDLVRYAARTLQVNKLVVAMGVLQEHEAFHPYPGVTEPSMASILLQLKDELTLEQYGHLIAMRDPSQAWLVIERGSFTHADKISLLKHVFDHINGNTYTVIRPFVEQGADAVQLATEAVGELEPVIKSVYNHWEHNRYYTPAEALLLNQLAVTLGSLLDFQSCAVQGSLRTFIAATYISVSDPVYRATQSYWDYIRYPLWVDSHVVFAARVLKEWISSGLVDGKSTALGVFIFASENFVARSEWVGAIAGGLLERLDHENRQTFAQTLLDKVLNVDLVRDGAEILYNQFRGTSGYQVDIANSFESLKALKNIFRD